MKTTYSSHKQVAEAFATQSTPTGKTSGNRVYFEGDTIYSYGPHFVIARLEPETRAAFFTTRRYSPSTGKHKSYVRWALHRAGWNVVQVERPEYGRPSVVVEEGGLPWLQAA